MVLKAAGRGKIHSAFSAEFTTLLIEDIITVELSTPVPVQLTIIKRQPLQWVIQNIPILST